ncbi:glycerophosphodiester phosphodiesterase family protein [Schinkia azotoformans]|uniref:glycerophosphodiester phosphodiesterase family protein n=1 Tax=Schinkia azotoformans TaxID=1454 RepID=UPI002DB8F60A|nr:glycerophosphodiester phosphodiesterase family protein [Schinkia azotoformans]MEC1773617.1 glycerophosphodiester phosphodiesterase family protein [Schinkia azotoformans]MED4365563.1 glycerophosphodiester phosphodiesterase family protein [Schinkia azotoformans]MED4377582.1 glycerophosphodiester phosphodiesterase family protein [Schinkia azotoformans]
MKKLKRNIKRFFIFLVILVGFIYLNNTSLFTRDSNKEPLLLAHRGMAQTFHMEGITGETCTAERIYEPEHPFLENTIASMEAAFEAGADIVEFDVQLTKDGEFAVFHDWALECRTDGKGAGLMPTLDEVMSHFPKQSFLIHIKSNDPNEGVHLSDYLTKFPDSRLKNLSVYGGDKPIASLKDKQPDMHVMSKAMLKSCLLPYIAVGWTGYVPAACENTQLHIPEKYAPYMWGFPNKFLNRMEEANTRVILVAGDGSWSEGFDKKQDLERLPKNYTGGIWTNRIDIIAPILKE